MDNSLTAFTKKIKFNISSRFLNHNTLIRPCVGWLSSHIREQKLTCKCMSPMTQPEAWTHFSPRQLKVCLHQTIFSFGKRHYYTSVTTTRDRQEQKPKPTERQWAVPVSPVILARLLRSSEPQDDGHSLPSCLHGSHLPREVGEPGFAVICLCSNPGPGVS